MRAVCRTEMVCLLVFLLFGCISTGESVESGQQAQVSSRQSEYDGGGSVGFSPGGSSDGAVIASPREPAEKENLYKGSGLAVAVLPPELNGGEPWMQQSFQDNITSLLASHTDMTVLDRKNEDLMIAQQELSETGLYSEEGAVEIGQMTNAQYVVVGSIRRLPTAYECNFRVNETATNEIRSASTSRHSLQEMESGAAVRQIVQELLVGLEIQLSEAERASLQKKEDMEAASITMLAKGAQAQAAEDYIQAVLYYNQVSGTFQQEAQTSTTQMLSASPDNLTVRQRQQYNQTQQAKWKKIFGDLQAYLDENLWLGVYDLNVEEANATMNAISYKVAPGVKIFENRKAIIVAKRVLEEWEQVKQDADNKTWIGGVSQGSPVSEGYDFRFRLGLFDGDGNLLAESSMSASDWISDLVGRSTQYAVKGQRKYFNDGIYAQGRDFHGGSIRGAIFYDIKIADMSENTVVPTVRILDVSGSNSRKGSCRLTLYSLAEWEALMAAQ